MCSPARGFFEGGRAMDRRGTSTSQPSLARLLLGWIPMNKLNPRRRLGYWSGGQKLALSFAITLRQTECHPCNTNRLLRFVELCFGILVRLSCSSVLV